MDKNLFANFGSNYFKEEEQKIDEKEKLNQEEYESEDEIDFYEPPAKRFKEMTQIQDKDIGTGLIRSTFEFVSTQINNDKNQQQDFIINKNDLLSESEFLSNNAHIFKRVSFYALIDGQEGKECAKFINYQLLNTFLDYYKKVSLEDILSDKAIRITFKKTIADLDEQIRVNGFPDSATLLIILIINDVCYVCQLGASRAYLCRSNKPGSTDLLPYKQINLANEHKIYILNERERIEKSGGFIKNGLVNGMLEVTRTLGYNNLRQFGVLGKPEFKKFLFDYNDDNFILCISDSYAKAKSTDNLIDKIYNELKNQNNFDKIKLLLQQEFQEIANKRLTDDCITGFCLIVNKD